MRTAYLQNGPTLLRNGIIYILYVQLILTGQPDLVTGQGPWVVPFYTYRRGVVLLLYQNSQNVSGFVNATCTDLFGSY